MTDLKQDLLNSLSIKDKCKLTVMYSQHLYAALCENKFVKNDYECVYSWVEAAHIVSKLNDGGDYDSYDYDPLNFVCESFITNEIKTDLLQMGWSVAS